MLELVSQELVETKRVLKGEWREVDKNVTLNVLLDVVFTVIDEHKSVLLDRTHMYTF